MTKEQTLTSIDSELKKKAKEAQINISAVTEEAIKRKLGQKVVNANEPIHCEFCGRVHLDEFGNALKETAETAKHPDPFTPWRLTWLWPDEMWICNRCLHKKSVKSSICR